MTDLVWPRLLELPSEDVRVVYLDLNHWISLAQASTGHSQGVRFVTTLEACRAAKSAGTAFFVLSALHYMEMNKIKNPSQRRNVANVMEELTGFDSIVDRVTVMKLELDSMLDPLASEPSPLPRTALVGRGVFHTFGRAGGVRILGPRGDATEEVRLRVGVEAFDDLTAQAELLLNRSVLRGPDDCEVEELRAFGWKPEATIQVAEKRAAQERRLTTTLAGQDSFRRARLHDVISARELCIEFQDILPQALAQRRLTFTNVVSNQRAGRKFVRAMPSTNVSIELKTAWHRNPDKPWTANDIYDIDAMSLAVPYCDIVVTEKACQHVLSVARLGEQMHTALLRDLEHLPSTLDQWKPRRGIPIT